MTDQITVQWSVDMTQWRTARDQEGMRRYIHGALRSKLGEAMIKALAEGWIISSAVTESEFDSVRNYEGYDSYFLRSLPPQLAEDMAGARWPPRRVFQWAVKVTKPEGVRLSNMEPGVVWLALDAILPPGPTYDEWSRTPWATDVWPPGDDDELGLPERFAT